jgi:hypothetical protein
VKRRQQCLAENQNFVHNGFMMTTDRNLPPSEAGGATALFTDRDLLSLREEPYKNFATLDARNPLKSIDSDERIQGNPRKTKPRNPRKTKKAGEIQRKPRFSKPGAAGEMG